MNFISVENLSKSYADKVLFDNVSFGLNRGDKVALVANNGQGKSTLLKMISGEDIGDEGIITLRNGVRLAYLPQEPSFDHDLTVNEIILGSDNHLQKLIDNYNKAVENNTVVDSSETRSELEKAIAEMDANNAWDYDRRLKELLDRFKITDTERKVGELSGGQVKRLSLAITLLDTPDILLLDEPTNHLDIDIIEWLEEYLQTSTQTLLMVTHDRYFLDRVCNNILELTNGNIYHHRGNYSYFLEKRAERIENQKIEVDKAKKLMKKELDWIRRMPKARTTKSKARIDSFTRTKEKAHSLKKEAELKLNVSMSRVGGKILEMNNVSFGYPNLKLLEDFNYIFKKGERIGLVGNNGVGKTTFLDLVMGQKLPESGTVLTGDTIVYGYYRQEGIKIKENQTVLQVVKDIAEIIPAGKGESYTASQFLNHFMFPPKVQNDYVSKLSGGEKRRLYLLTVLVRNPNFLILDEPTNDLDLITLNKLEEFLENYKGCLILVSHDRYFLDKLVDHIFVFEGEGKIKDYYSNYTEYKLKKDLEDSEKRAKQASDRKISAKQTEKPKKEKTKLNYNEKREYDKLMADIEKLEGEKHALETELNSGIEDYQKIQEISERLGIIIDQIDEKTNRWMELDEFV